MLQIRDKHIYVHIKHEYIIPFIDDNQSQFSGEWFTRSILIFFVRISIRTKSGMPFFDLSKDDFLAQRAPVPV
jgi:hypothetical protein